MVSGSEVSCILAPMDSSFSTPFMNPAATFLSVVSETYSFGIPNFIPFISFPTYEVKSSAFSSLLVESSGS